MRKYLKRNLLSLYYAMLHGIAYASCPNGYYKNTIDITKLNYMPNGVWQSTVSTYKDWSYTSQGLSVRCEGYDETTTEKWFGTDEGGTCLDCRFDNMVHGDWYLEFDPKNTTGFTTLYGTSACISSSYATNMDTYQASDSVKPSNGEKTGNSCWCKLTAIDEISVNARWVYNGSNSYWSTNTCIQECAQTCVSELRTKHELRKALFDSVYASTVSGCTALNQTIYDITYDLSGGVNYPNAPFCYKIISGEKVFKSPSKSGDVFLHWADKNNNIVKSIPSGNTGNVHIIAKWQSDFKGCPAGDWLYDTICVNVGNGFYSPEGDIDRYECPYDFVTIGFGLGADEIGDCGRILHIGDKQIYLRSIKNTTPAVYVKFDDQIFYGSMSEKNIGPMHILYQGKEYTVYDDSMLK